MSEISFYLESKLKSIVSVGSSSSRLFPFYAYLIVLRMRI